MNITWKEFFFEGLFFVLIGMAAIALPGLFTLSIEMIIGFLFLIGGIVQSVRAIKSWKNNGSGVELVSALLSVAIGATLLAYPLSGMVTLTLLLGIFFVIDGIAKISWGWPNRTTPQWWGIVLSGIISLFLAAIILSGLPGTAAWTIGLLVGINMLFFGIALMAISYQMKGSK